MTITANDGNSCTILKDDNTVVHSENGIAVGDHVEIAYTGALADNTAVAHSIIVTSETENKTAPTPMPEESTEDDADKDDTAADIGKSDDKDKADDADTEKAADDFATKKLYGKVVDASNSNITIRNDNGMEWTILKDDNTKINLDISNGTPVEVICYTNGNGALQATVIN